MIPGCYLVVFRAVTWIITVIIGAVPALCENAPSEGKSTLGHAKLCLLVADPPMRVEFGWQLVAVSVLWCFCFGPRALARSLARGKGMAS